MTTPSRDPESDRPKDPPSDEALPPPPASDSVLDYALKYAEIDFDVVTIYPRSKSPRCEAH
jgi:hypothetical protein